MGKLYFFQNVSLTSLIQNAFHFCVQSSLKIVPLEYIGEGKDCV